MPLCRFLMHLARAWCWCGVARLRWDVTLEASLVTKQQEDAPKKKLESTKKPRTLRQNSGQ